ncbi:hypothetical protein ACTI_24610 [Actinoplanes sp. OR16]|uniref:TetR/AcrR family transcriptional regulator n=1 Tax=Actinoplanes sp. OR16 TaxID=946334 RepID=UPI000F6F7106|nr:TetR/AcrR family transcriptional regulator [Actinoplanes sp. OR16]BBH65776.1 hypothetical protein ACTI_24610 [Actinoplanes sp. OR16]
MPLTPSSITRTALLLGDRDGEAAMSMRRIAAELGCDPMALYRHFPNRQALLDAVADMAIGDVGEGEPAGEWDVRLTALLTEIREVALRHPGIAGHIAARPPLGENGLRLNRRIGEALAAAGLGPSEAGKAAQALIAYLAAALAMAVKAGERDERWHQVTAALGREMPVVGSEEQFAYGLRLLIAGIRVEGQQG